MAPAQFQDSAYLGPPVFLRAQPDHSASIHSNSWPAKYHAFGLHILQSSFDPLRNQITLKLCNRRHDREQCLSKGRGRADVLRIADKLNSQRPLGKVQPSHLIGPAISFPRNDLSRLHINPQRRAVNHIFLVSDDA